MKPLSSFLVQRRNLLLVLMLLLAVVCGLMVPRVNVNTDMTKYLPADSEMKAALDTMSVALGDDAMSMLSVRAMYRGLSHHERDSLADAFRQMEGVKALTAVQEKEGYVLYDLTIAADGNPKAVASQIRGGDLDVVVETSIDGNMPDPIVFIVAALLVFAILFLMCESWVEPLLFLATIGVAVLLNMGSNVLLSSVSMTTHAIVAILQLVLSMDYSIILMNRYRQELAVGDDDREAAMRRALAAASPSVLSSAFTTMAGLLMLCFMKFRIGMDLGIVLAKGVLCSVLCLYTILPALVLLFHNAIWRSRKRVPVPNTDRLARFELRFRIPLAVVAVVVFVASLYLHNLTAISFSTNWPTTISEVFPRKNTVVLLYENKDEDRLLDLVETLSLDAKVDTVVSYPTLMRRQLTSHEMYASLKGLSAMLDPQAAAMIDSMLTPDMLEMVYLLRQHDGLEDSVMAAEVDDITEIVAIAHSGHKVPMVTITTGQSAGAMAPVVSVAPVPQADSSEAHPTDIAPMERTEAAVPIPTYRDTILTPMTAAALSAYLGFDSKQAATLYCMAGRAKGTMSPLEFVRYVNDKVLPNKLYASFISKEQTRQLTALRHRMEAALQAPAEPVTEVAVGEVSPADTVAAADSAMTAHATDTMVTKDTALVALVPATSEATEPSADEGVGIPTAVGSGIADTTCSLEQLVTFLTEELINDPAFAAFIDDSIRNRLGDVRSMMEQGVGQLKGDRWSMAAIVTSYPDEGDEVQQFLHRLREVCDSHLSGDYKLVGESVMFNEMQQGFGRELLLLTVLTILAILVIVTLTFRSIVVPVMLLLTVLTGVYLNVFISGLGGRSLLYLAYLIVQSILMGATIDYAILFTNYYREGRRTQGVGESLKAAYRGSIRTIMTSGLIIVLAPGIMSLLVTDHTIASIVGCLAVGGLSAIMLILFVLPGCLAACDRWVQRKK